MSISVLRKYKRISAAHWFMISVMIVNAGNYFYNLILGRWLGPSVFANVALLVTFLLMLSFLAMTIQLVAAKFIIELPQEKKENFKKVVYKYTLLISLLIAGLLYFNTNVLVRVFQLPTKSTLKVFSLGIPLYFIMSVSRGLHQGKQRFVLLSQSYLMEMLGRLTITFLLIGLHFFEPTISVAVGILISFILGLFPNQFRFSFIKQKSRLSKAENKLIFHFLIVTLLYEGAQIIINNSDILIVKHYFDNEKAGLYASLALIGRVVYFIIWMLIMVLIPKVIQLKKEGGDPSLILNSYLRGILFLTVSLVFLCYLFPQQIIILLFGKAYVSLAPLLYKYALATSLFALANLFIYYFLALSKYKPVIIATCFGISQVIFLIFFHKSLQQIVDIQIALMSTLLLVIYLYKSKYTM